MRMLSGAFEIQHSVNDMLESLRARNRAVFSDVADNKSRDVVLLRPEQQPRRNFAYLPDRAGSHLEFFTERCLDRIDDYDFRCKLFGSAKNFLDGHLWIDVQVVCRDREAFAAHFDLVD